MLPAFSTASRNPSSNCADVIVIVSGRACAVPDPLSVGEAVAPCSAFMALTARSAMPPGIGVQYRAL
jgi:hypothetical protein